MDGFVDLAPAVELGITGRLYLALLLVGVPALSLVRPDREAELPPRLPLYASAATVVWILAGLTGLVLLLEGVGLAEIGLRSDTAPAVLVWSTGITLLTLGANFLITRIGAALGASESRLVYHLMPETRRERYAFMGLAVSAGFCEELVYHGFTMAGLAAWLGSGWWAAAVANVAFGILHGYQNTVGVVRAGLMGYVLCLPVIVGPGLWPAIIAHLAVNALLGLGLWKWMLPPDQPGPGSSSRPPTDSAV